MKKERVVILGASNKPERYSHKALNLLKDYGHEVVLVHPTLKEIDGLEVYSSLSQIKGKVDTLTMYISSELSSKIIGDIIKLRPKRIIFNPGTENAELYNKLLAHSIPFELACTLVLLRSEQF